MVLPVWGDTYDFAKRAEWLGVGRFGSWKHAPKVDEKELGGVLKDVVLGPKAASFKAKAAELAALCKKEGGGRRVAAKTILAALDDKGDSSDE